MNANNKSLDLESLLFRENIIFDIDSDKNETLILIIKKEAKKICDKISQLLLGRKEEIELPQIEIYMDSNFRYFPSEKKIYIPYDAIKWLRRYNEVKKYLNGKNIDELDQDTRSYIYQEKKRIISDNPDISLRMDKLNNLIKTIDELQNEIDKIKERHLKTANIEKEIENIKDSIIYKIIDEEIEKKIKNYIRAEMTAHFLKSIEFLSHEIAHHVIHSTTNIKNILNLNLDTIDLNTIKNGFIYRHLQEFLAQWIGNIIMKDYLERLECFNYPYIEKVKEIIIETDERRVNKTLETLDEDYNFLKSLINLIFRNSNRYSEEDLEQEKFELSLRLSTLSLGLSLSKMIMYNWGIATSYFLTREENIQLIREIHNDLKEVKTEEDLGRIFNKWIYRTVNFLREKRKGEKENIS